MVANAIAHSPTNARGARARPRLHRCPPARSACPGHEDGDRDDDRIGGGGMGSMGSVGTALVVGGSGGSIAPVTTSITTRQNAPTAANWTSRDRSRPAPAEPAPAPASAPLAQAACAELMIGRP